jgi:hypothetical protein
MSIVLLGSKQNRIGSTGRGMCSCSGLISMSAWIGASIGIMSHFSTVEAHTISLRQVLGSLGHLNILTPSSRGLVIVGVLNILTLRGRESLSRWLRSRLKLWLSRTEHRSNWRCSNTGGLFLLPSWCFRTSLCLRSITTLWFSSTRALFAIPWKFSKSRASKAYAKPSFKSFKKQFCFFSSVSTSLGA